MTSTIVNMIRSGLQPSVFGRQPHLTFSSTGAVRHKSGIGWGVLRIVFFSSLAVQPISADEPPVETKPAAANVEKTDKPSITFSKADPIRVRSELQQWLQTSGAEEATIRKVMAQWSNDTSLAKMSAEDLLDLLIESFAESDAATRRLYEASCGSGPVDGLIYDGIRATPIFKSPVQLFHARWLTQHRYYDEALPLLEELAPDEVMDPASLLFYRAVCRSQLLKNSDALDDLSLLLNNTLDVPSRFRVMAEILRQELESQKSSGLSEASRLMKDVERRLDLGRPDQKTQDQEKAIIAALDKLLDEMNQQKQQQSGSGSGSGSPQNQPGSQGADQSKIKGSTADGKADHKELKETGKWGLLDDQAETKARELIRQKFPSNYLDQISRYTRKLAEQKK